MLSKFELVPKNKSVLVEEILMPVVFVERLRRVWRQKPITWTWQKAQPWLNFTVQSASSLLHSHTRIPKDILSTLTASETGVPCLAV